MRRVGIKPTTPVFKRAKAVHALDLSVIVIGSRLIYIYISPENSLLYSQKPTSCIYPVPVEFRSALYRHTV
jgi:hypothetical protein